MKSKIIITGIIIAGILIVAIASFLFFMQGPDLSSYESLSNPRITTKSNEKVLEVFFDAPGDKIGAELSKCYEVLFSAYFKLKGVPKGSTMKACKARYENLFAASQDGKYSMEDLKKLEWKGSVAIPIPDNINELPDKSNQKVKISIWEYGEVAEILHKGPYENEFPVINKLQNFIKNHGYTIIGDHEEEYLKGPGMPFVSPKDYYTIIRYRIKKI
jgi:effector-binding domain-containing protein